MMSGWFLDLGWEENHNNSITVIYNQFSYISKIILYNQKFALLLLLQNTTPDMRFIFKKNTI